VKVVRIEQDVAVAPPALAGARRDARKHTAAGDLVLQRRLNHPAILPLRQLREHRLALGLLLLSLLLAALLLGLALPEGHAVVRLVPGLERRRVDHDDAVLHQRLRPHQLVVAGVVDDVNDARLARADLRTPGEVPTFQADCPELQVAPAAADGVNTLLSELGHGRRPAELELPLLDVKLALAAGVAALVARIA